MDDERDLDYERRRLERLRKRKLEKRRQMQRRKLMRLGILAVAVVLVLGLGITGIVKLVSHGGSKKQDPKTQAETVNENGLAEAVKQPVMGAADLEKLTSAGTIGWQRDEKGLWYRSSDGAFFENGFKEIDGEQYYFDENGYAVTGWLELNEKDYFFDDKGVYDETKRKPMIALTFDDGPGQYTEELLDCLQKYDSKATFFMLGQNAEAYPDVVKKVKEAGMEIGNHTYDHENLTTLDTDGVINEISSTNNIVANAIGEEPTLMRPPGGAYNEDVQNVSGKPLIMWSIDTRDWATRSVEQTYNVTMDNAKDGSIVLIHDIHEPSVQASLKIIPDLVEKGFKLVTVSELAAAKDITLENGEDYYYFGEGEQAVE